MFSVGTTVAFLWRNNRCHWLTDELQINIIVLNGQKIVKAIEKPYLIKKNDCYSKTNSLNIH